MSKSVLIRRTSLGKLIIRLWMAIVILLIPVSSYSLPYQSPRTQNVEQTNVPDYISQAKVAVKKYYPQYDEYFKPIFDQISKLDNLDRIAKKTKEIWTSEKDIYTTILMTLEKLTWENTFCNDDDLAKIIEEKDYKEWAAKAIAHSIKKWLEKRKNELEIIMEKWREMAERMRTIWNKNDLTREDDEELLVIIEDMYNLIENTEFIKDKRNKPIFKEYLSRCKDIGRSPKKEIVEWVKKNE